MTRRFETKFGSLDHYEKGAVEVIDDDPKHYTFSNVFEVASRSRPYEKIAVGQNRQYVLEAVRAEGTSGWGAASPHAVAPGLGGGGGGRAGAARGGARDRGRGGAGGRPHGAGQGRARPHDPAPGRGRLPVPRRPPKRHPDADDRGPGHRLQVGRHHPDVLGRRRRAGREEHPMATTETESSVQSTTERNPEGYLGFTLGEFEFSRDDYFVYINWPTGRHVMSADTFLKALQRDVAWEFFYGIVNFDGVIGTVNHYGDVDLFAGRYNDGWRKAELDHLENFPTAHIKATFVAMLGDWTNQGFDPFASPDETGTAFGPKNGSNTAAITRHRVTAQRMVGVPGDEGLRSDDPGHPVNRHFLDVAQDEPEIHPEPGFEGEVAGFNLFAYLSRSDVTWNPSVVAACKDSLACPTTEEYILPIIHGNDRVEWFVQLSDKIIWDVEHRDTGTVRAKVVMKAGDVCAMPADIRHQGYSPKRSMLLVWENAD